MTPQKTYNLKSIFLDTLKTLGGLFAFILIGLYLDSKHMVSLFPNTNTQLVANVVMSIGFLFYVYKSTPRGREMMIYAVLIAIVGEYLFSLGFDMYTYRLGNIPFYVPLGHGVLYIVTISFCHTPSMVKYKIQIEKIFTIAILVYASFFLIFLHDIFGFILSIATLLILRKHPRERLFYLTMYISVAYLEIIGTSYECWKWPSTAFGIIPFLKSYNPPCGISFFYFGLDLGCLVLYKLRHKIAWKRMKSIRSLSKQTL